MNKNIEQVLQAFKSLRSDEQYVVLEKLFTVSTGHGRVFVATNLFSLPTGITSVDDILNDDHIGR